MSVGDLSAGAAWLLLAGVAAAVLLLYLLKPSPRRLSVASALIWRRVLEQRKRRPERLRWWLSLLLALAIALSVAAALTRPEVVALSGTASDVVLVIDTSPTMATLQSDGRSRLAAAVERARQIIAGRGAGSRYLVADTMQQAGAGAFEAPAAALARLRALHPASAGTPWFPQVVFPDAGARSAARAASALVHHRRSCSARGAAGDAPGFRVRSGRQRRDHRIRGARATCGRQAARGLPRGHQCICQGQAGTGANRGHWRARRPAPARTGRRCERKRSGGRVGIRRRTAARWRARRR